MLRTWSSQNSDMTSRESTPATLSSRDISLAKDTLVAWNALQAYFSDSAVRGVDDPGRLVEESEQAGHRVGHGRVGGPDDHQRRGEEVGHPGAFAEKFRAHRGSGGDRRAGQAIGQRRDHDLLDRAGRHGTADDHAMVPGCRRRDRAQRAHDVVD